MKQTDIEVLPDGRVALILHDGKFDKPLSTHELKRAAVRAYFGVLADELRDLHRIMQRSQLLPTTRDVLEAVSSNLELK